MRLAKRTLAPDRRAAERRLTQQLADLAADDRAIVDLALPYTMTGVPRLQALIDAVRYVVAGGVPGAFAEGPITVKPSEAGFTEAGLARLSLIEVASG